MKVQYLIMAHPEREQYARNLASKLPDAHISWDDIGLGLIGAHKKVWGLADNAYDYCLVLQDDSILTNNFIAKFEYHLKNCAARYGETALHLYLRKSPKFQSIIENYKDSDHVLLDNLHAGLAVCLPTSVTQDMLTHFENQQSPSADMRINSYLNSIGMSVYFPLPSLVQHRNLPSLHTNNNSRMKDRVAMWFE